MRISYHFTDDHDLNETFAVHCDDDMQLIRASESPAPAWTELSFNQCDNCPLKTESHCPAATAITDLIEICEQLISYDEVTVTVTTDERTVIQKTTAQRGISALMGLLLAISGCPVTAVFRPMARFHLPFSSEMETLYRVTSMYALASHFVGNEGTDLAALSQTYAEVQRVNRAMANRIRQAATTDASTNALVILDTFAHSVPFYIDDSLEDLRDLFAPFVASEKRSGSILTIS